VKLPTVVFFAACALSVSAETVNLEATNEGVLCGRASVTIDRKSRAHYFVQTDVHFLVAGKDVESTGSELLARDGSLDSSETMIKLDGALKRHEKSVWTGSSETVLNLVTGDRKTRTWPDGRRDKDPSDLWFVAYRPKPKTRISVFVDVRGKWMNGTRTYVGDADVMRTGRRLRGHAIKLVDRDGTFLMVVDDHGLPLSFRDGNMLFTRV
jgi:hypothetical protein